MFLYPIILQILLIPNRISINFIWPSWDRAYFHIWTLYGWLTSRGCKSYRRRALIICAIIIIWRILCCGLNALGRGRENGSMTSVKWRPGSCQSWQCFLFIVCLLICVRYSLKLFTGTHYTRLWRILCPLNYLNTICTLYPQRCKSLLLLLS